MVYVLYVVSILYRAIDDGGRMTFKDTSFNLNKKKILFLNYILLNYFTDNIRSSSSAPQPQ